MHKVYTIVIALLMVLGLKAQDVHFSQFWQTPVLMNPGMTGIMPGDIRLNASYRNQWSSVASPFRTYAFSGDFLFQPKGNVDIGAGLSVYRDVAGDVNFSTTQAQLALSAILSLDDYSKISVGFKGGILQKNINVSEMQWGNQYQTGGYNPAIDPGEVINASPGIQPDIAVGAVYTYASDERYMSANDQFSAQVGLAYNHINKPKFEWRVNNTDSLYSHFVLNAELLIGLGNSPISAVPSGWFMFQGPSREIMLGSLFRYEIQEASKITGFIKHAFLYLGAHYRVGDAVVPSLLLELDQYAIGFSYDLNTSALRAASGAQGGFEVTLRFQTPEPYFYKSSKASFR